MNPEHSLHVKYCHTQNLISVGRLALIDRKIFFEYSPTFLEQGLQLSPFKLPLGSGVISCQEQVFEGLFGVFNDSLPDGWGRLLLDRKLISLGINPASLTPLDRLKYVGTRGMGALRYEPEMTGIIPKKRQVELDILAEECWQFQENEEVQYIDDLLSMNGSSAGARPKILVSIDPQSHKFLRSDNNVSHPHNDWIVKFRSAVDPKDAGPIEYAYHLMALEAGLDVPEAKLFKSRIGPGHFGVKRFDRTHDAFFHVHTLSGLLHADYRIPSLDYETVLKATYIITKSRYQLEKQFRNATFNVFSHNRDDHAKNFSFIMDGVGVWSVSPAYDLTFSSGPGGEHCTMLMGNGKNPGTADLLRLARGIKIDERRAKEIIDEVKESISKWKLFASIANVSQPSSKMIHTLLKKAL
ncbi:MAG: type II toxin-antitoxin system HipA family toxin [Chlamydiales bacterium]